MHRFLLTLSLLATAAAARAQGPIVFIDGNGSEQQAARETVTVKRHDQTMELAKNLLKSCKEISITRNEDLRPDYFLLLTRGEEYGFFASAVTQVMVLDRAKNVLFAIDKGTVAKAAKEGCRAILSDWKAHRGSRASQTSEPEPLWNKQSAEPQK